MRIPTDDAKAALRRELHCTEADLQAAMRVLAMHITQWRLK